MAESPLVTATPPVSKRLWLGSLKKTPTIKSKQVVEQKSDTQRIEMAGIKISQTAARDVRDGAEQDNAREALSPACKTITSTSSCSLVDPHDLQSGVVEEFDELIVKFDGAEPRRGSLDGEESQDLDIARDLSSEQRSKVRTAYGEVRHHAGGLISHPYEVAKHYSVLRHGIGLVFYKGPSTRIAITIFSDQALPNERTLWLQKRGFSGNMGMRLGAALGSKKAWIDVTPSIDALADQLPAADERTWQRDITKFLKKAAKSKKLGNHRACETDVVRLPGTAEDGYFRIVVCVGDDVLCYSPVFRYASSSLDPSTLRGASITTLPLELGIRITSFAIRTTAETAAGGAIEPALDAVHSITEPYELYGLTQWAAESAYTTSGAADKVDGKIEEINEKYKMKCNLELTTAQGELKDVNGHQVGSDEGPVLPYPICFSASVVGRPKHSQLVTGFAAVRLTDILKDTLLRLSGKYTSWVSLAGTDPRDYHDDSTIARNGWFNAVVVVMLKRRPLESVVPQKEVILLMPCELLEMTSFGAVVNVMLMSFLGSHAVDEHHVEGAMVLESQQLGRDITAMKNSLNRPAWQPSAVLKRIEASRAGRSWTERVADVRRAGQRHINKVPFHKLGVRTHGMTLEDQLVGHGGLRVLR